MQSGAPYSEQYAVSKQVGNTFLVRCKLGQKKDFDIFSGK